MLNTRSVLLLAMLGGLALAPQTMTPALAQNIPLPPGVVFFDGHRYLLPEAAIAKNAEAVRALITAGNQLGMVRGNTYGNQTHLALGNSTHRWRDGATGRMNGGQVKVTMGMDYRLP